VQMRKPDLLVKLVVEGASAMVRQMGGKGWETLRRDIDKHLLRLREKILSGEGV